MEKIWLKNYEQGVTPEINYSKYQSLVDLFNDGCEKFPDHTSFENMGVEITYSELLTLSRQFAIFLQRQGLQKGDRVAIMMPNVLQYPVALFGILSAGLIVVNTNPLYTKDELVHQLNDSGAKAIVVLANFAHTVEKALPEVKGLDKIIITEIGDLFPPVKRIIVNSVVKYIKKMVPNYSIPNAIKFNDAIKEGKDGELKKAKLTHDDIAFLQYTGGTTGIAKGAMLTHGNMLANVTQAQTWIKPKKIDYNEIIVIALPLYHIFALTANCLTFLNKGAKHILITNPRDIKTFIKEIKDSKFTNISGVNTLYNALVNHPDFKDVDFSRVKIALAGGMALQEKVANGWKKITNIPITEAYGLTETSPAVTINPFYVDQFNGSIGLPISSTDISIRNDEGDELPVGEKGELCIKGPQVMAGYWKREDETKKSFWPDNYLRSGDIATVDEKGFVYLVDRKKDMILVSGFNVYPTEVEQIISMMPEVLEVGVIGIKDEESGEKVKACIVKKDPNLTKDAVIAHCREKLTGYKVPKIVEFFDELPKTNVGKILRRALR